MHMHVWAVCVCQNEAYWSPLKPAGVKPQKVETNGACHMGTEADKVEMVGQRQPAKSSQKS